MITKTKETILQHIRSLKEENAAEYEFSLEAIIESARQRQEASSHPVIRLRKREQRVERKREDRF